MVVESRDMSIRAQGEVFNLPEILDAICRDTERLGFTMASEPETGSLLRVLAASKPRGRLLELGTGTGMGTAWLLAGMDANARLDSVDSDVTVLDVARRHLGHDSRLTFHVADGAAFLAGAKAEHYDLIFADTWAGKFTHLDLTLSLLRPGGIYIVDDLHPQPSWSDGHASKVVELIADLERRPGFVSTHLTHATGLMVLVRTAAV
jgi:predicted O-methyltransferase YrrM